MTSGVDAWRVVKRAESLGFSHAWFVDTQLLCADLFVSMAVAAVHTSRIRLGTGVTNVNPRDHTVLEPGMVLSTEPGIRLDGVYCLWEDVHVITEEGHEQLRPSPLGCPNG